MQKKFPWLFLFLSGLFLFTGTLLASPSPYGKWTVEGTTSEGKSYSGEIFVKKKRNNTVVSGSYSFKKAGTKLFSFIANSKKYRRNTLKYTFTIVDKEGLLKTLSNLGSLGNPAKMKVKAKMRMAFNGHTFKGSWNAKSKRTGKTLSGKEVWTRYVAKLEIHSIIPNQLEGGRDFEQIFTLTGKNFPSKEELRPVHIKFLSTNSKNDLYIHTREILEVSDDGTLLKIRVALKKKVVAGIKHVKIQKGLATGVGKNLLEIKKAAMKLPIGGKDLLVRSFDLVKVYIPNKEGGTLKIESIDVDNLKLRFGFQGKEVKGSEKNEFEVTQSGWYYIDISDNPPEEEYLLQAKYAINGNVSKEKKPWNFYYYPFLEDLSSPKENFYSDGGIYERLDILFGLEPKKDGWKNFKPNQHMDRKKDDLPIQKLAKKYYRGYQWTLPKDPQDLEFLKKHNPSTMKGYGYSYQRSEDYDKGWWGHCWGAVVASSLYQRPPGAKTVKDANGKDITFSQEDLEGILVAYHTNHSVYPISYMGDCPAGPPTDKKKEPCDSYCDDYFIGLMTGIRQNGLALATNIRASYATKGNEGQIWNQVAFKFKAEISEIDGDETHLKIKLKVYYSDDIFPSDEDDAGELDYEITLKYNLDGTIDRDNMKYQNWIKANAYCPGYLWRIQRSARDNTENLILKGRIEKLIKIFGFKKIK